MKLIANRVLLKVSTKTGQGLLLSSLNIRVCNGKSNYLHNRCESLKERHILKEFSPQQQPNLPCSPQNLPVHNGGNRRRAHPLKPLGDILAGMSFENRQRLEWFYKNEYCIHYVLSEVMYGEDRIKGALDTGDNIEP